MTHPNGLFDFEEPLLRLMESLGRARLEASPRHGEIERLSAEIDRKRRQIYSGLNAWQRTQVARHSARPYTLDYARALFGDFVELHGDRKFADDPAIVTGFGTFCGQPVAVVGHQKGRDTKQKVYRNFGMPKPEGYRKALRVIMLAEKFGRPILCFIDTPGAYPGIGAEERGQAEAIAYNLKAMAMVRVPIVVVVTGEGGSGGALAIGVGDRVLMMEHAVYSVISPEACSSILFRTSDRAAEAAEALKMTALDLHQLGIIDDIVPEPVGGAHSDPIEAARLLGEALARALEEVSPWSPEERLERRYQKFRKLGVFDERELRVARG